MLSVSVSVRLFRLLEEIMAEKENKTIIFTETKRGSDELTRQMRREGWPGMCIHGDKSQQERDWVLREFRSGRSPILVATDVAARGLGKWAGVASCGRRQERTERHRPGRVHPGQSAATEDRGGAGLYRRTGTATGRHRALYTVTERTEPRAPQLSRPLLAGPSHCRLLSLCIHSSPVGLCRPPLN